MTAQISDTIYYMRKKYELIGISKGSLFCPEHYGMQPEMIHTACYSGFYVTYTLSSKGLFLKNLFIYVPTGKYKPINGVLPEGGNYRNVRLPITYTGTIRLAREFIQDRYIHMGYQRPTAYRTVLDITLSEGTITHVLDRSPEVENMRTASNNHYSKADDLFTFIEDSFRRGVELK